MIALVEHGVHVERAALCQYLCDEIHAKTGGGCGELKVWDALSWCRRCTSSGLGGVRPLKAGANTGAGAKKY